MQGKIRMIAQTFGAVSGKIVTAPCRGKWRGASDISIRFDNGKSLYLGTRTTSAARTAKAQNELVNNCFLQYNPEIVAVTKAVALAALREREVVDNAIAAQKGAKPYTVLNVELCDGVSDENGSSSYIGWYYVTVAVDGKIRAHLETNSHYAIANGKVGEKPARNCYHTACGINDADVDYIFSNVGHSTTSTMYSLPITADVLERAKKTLAGRCEMRAAVEGDNDTHWKPSIRTQLAAKPVPGDQPIKKTKDLEVR